MATAPHSTYLAVSDTPNGVYCTSARLSKQAVGLQLATRYILTGITRFGFSTIITRIMSSVMPISRKRGSVCVNM